MNYEQQQQQYDDYDYDDDVDYDDKVDVDVNCDRREGEGRVAIIKMTIKRCCRTIMILNDTE